MKHFSPALFFVFILAAGCNTHTEEEATPFEVYCEMVANDAKPLALSPPLNYEELDQKWAQFEKIAEEYGVKLYRENQFPVTPLFPEDLTREKDVVVIYQKPRLTQYLQLKSDLSTLDPALAARRLGRLLGYSPQGINERLMKNSDFRTLESFGVNQQVTHLYYEDLEKAMTFYHEILKLPREADRQFRIGTDAMIQLHSATEQHPAGQPKSTAIALLTDQLPEWYAYVQEKDVEIKYTYKPREGGPHDGFVAIDPGGYLLEFEQFKQHPENELFMAGLESTPEVVTGVDSLNFYGSITWTYHKDLLKMQNFYEQELGFRMVADQGWTKIFQTSHSGFIGLVDERRGMMDYADEKAVEIEWQMSATEDAIEYFSKLGLWYAESVVLVGPEKYRYKLR